MLQPKLYLSTVVANMYNHIAVAAADPAAELHDPLAELHMEDYDTDEEQDEMQEATASRLFGGGNPGESFAYKQGTTEAPLSQSLHSITYAVLSICKSVSCYAACCISGAVIKTVCNHRLAVMLAITGSATNRLATI